MTPRLALPAGFSRYALAGAAHVWLGVAMGDRWLWPALLVGLAASSVVWLRGAPERRVTALLFAPLVLAGHIAALPSPAPDLPAGSVQLVVEVVEMPRPGEWDASVLVAPRAVVDGERSSVWNGPRGFLSGDVLEWIIGERHRVVASMRLSGDAWSGTVRSAERVESSMWGEAIAWVRNRVDDVVLPHASQGRALLTGLLVGDTTELDPMATEEMRLAGLSHLVAVSGSNVALFLGTIFVLVGPLAWSSRRRAFIGIPSVLFFVGVIGPDPSVIRAAAMAVIVLAAHAAGVRPQPWTTLGVGVGVLLLVAPDLAGRLGFQLSVAATAGVLACARAFPGIRPRWLSTLLGASVGAQVAVAPLLLVHIGSMPVFAPLANLVAVPVAGLASVIGVVATIVGSRWLAGLAARLSEVILVAADVVAPLPQLAVGGAAVAAAVCGAAWFARPLRPFIAIAFAATLLLVGSPTGRPLDPATMVALDVGQGDAILLRGEGGATVLIDGGPDPVVLLEGLRRWRVDRIDLVMVSHGHADHYAGLAGLWGEIHVGTVWVGPSPDPTNDFGEFMDEAARWSVVVEPDLGVHRIGEIDLRVLGPARRYASANDQSLVVAARVSGTTVLLSGDIEELAQQELGSTPVDVLKVPHHGASTTDPAWLRALGAELAIISVGTGNRFGHPHPDLLEALRSAGMRVLRTDLSGDVVVPLRP